MKYYKITNKEEIHKGMQYNDGLNIDIIPFNPSGDCESGGIYFSRKDVLAFLGHGVWIREVTLPEDEDIYENPGEPKKWKSHRVILGERRLINLDVIKELVEEGANIHSDDDSALRWASLNGYLDIIKYLFEQGADVHADNDWALRCASNNGHLEMVKYLIEQGANIHAGDDWALRNASECRHLEVVKYLKSVMEKDA